MSVQKEAFLKYEANQWFKRNKNILSNYDNNSDPIIKLISKYDLKFESVVEIGSSAGYRLNGIKQKFNTDNLIGIEPSIEAINFGKNKYPFITFINSTMDDLSVVSDKSIDLIIVGFVFYVVDRNLLFKCLDEINRIIKENGKVIILDFYSATPKTKRYHHITEFQAFTYKVNYSELFTSSGIFELIDFSTFNHSSMINDSETDIDDLVSLTLLRKITNEYF